MGIGIAFSGLLFVAVLVASALAVLATMAALGLTSFALLERFRKRDREEPEDGGIDDLF